MRESTDASGGWGLPASLLFGPRFPRESAQLRTVGLASGGVVGRFPWGGTSPSLAEKGAERLLKCL